MQDPRTIHHLGSDHSLSIQPWGDNGAAGVWGPFGDWGVRGCVHGGRGREFPLVTGVHWENLGTWQARATVLTPGIDSVAVYTCAHAGKSLGFCWCDWRLGEELSAAETNEGFMVGVAFASYTCEWGCVGTAFQAGQQREPRRGDSHSLVY